MKNEHCVVVVVGGGDVLLVVWWRIGCVHALLSGEGRRWIMDMYCIILSACDDLSEEDEN